MQKFAKKQKYLNLGPKITYLSILGLEFENDFIIIEIRTFIFA